MAAPCCTGSASSPSSTPPVSIQRWSTQRLLHTAAAALGVLLLTGLFVDSLRAGLG